MINIQDVQTIFFINQGSVILNHHPHIYVNMHAFVRVRVRVRVCVNRNVIRYEKHFNNVCFKCFLIASLQQEYNIMKKHFTNVC